ncbi:MAG: hypothetical protein LKJ31_02045 [Atopobiaceae bacterium]|nr:hypothetical protein [Atopobiaceae bacterium]
MAGEILATACRSGMSSRSRSLPEAMAASVRLAGGLAATVFAEGANQQESRYEACYAGGDPHEPGVLLMSCRSSRTLAVFGATWDICIIETYKSRLYVSAFFTSQ